MKKLFIPLIAILLSCCDEKCTDTACTEQLVMVGLQVKDQDGNTIQLDSSKTYKVAEVIFSETYTEESITYHTVITDAQMDQLSFEGIELIFKGWLEGEELVIQDFIVGRDCCHIIKKEGPESITLP